MNIRECKYVRCKTPFGKAKVGEIFEVISRGSVTVEVRNSVGEKRVRFWKEFEPWEIEHFKERKSQKDVLQPTPDDLRKLSELDDLMKSRVSWTRTEDPEKWVVNHGSLEIGKMVMDEAVQHNAKEYGQTREDGTVTVPPGVELVFEDNKLVSVCPSHHDEESKVMEAKWKAFEGLWREQWRAPANWVTKGESDGRILSRAIGMTGIEETGQVGMRIKRK